MKSLDERFDIRSGFLEHHATNGPNVRVKFGVSAEEVAREDTSCGNIPGATWGTCEVKPKLLRGTTLFNLRIPVTQVTFVDDLFEPVILTNQPFHVCSNVTLRG